MTTPGITTAPEPLSSTGQVKADSIWTKLALHRVPPKYLLTSAFVSYLILGICYLQGVVIWLAFGLAFVPWVLMVFVELQWTYEHFHWLALFGLLVFVQTVHYSEHCIEVVQVHIFHDSLYDAQAIFGSFNREWVHFLGDTVLSIGTFILITKYPRNIWLYVSGFFQILHQAEHTFLIYNYLFMHVKAGGPGLLASPDGAIFGGIGLNRPDLHWIYNTLYTVPFFLAFVYQLRRVYDSSLDKAFRGVSSEELLAESKKMQTLHYAADETVLAPGDAAHRVFVIIDGAAEVTHLLPDGREHLVATLRRGQYFGEMAILLPGAPHTKTVRALDDLSVLAMDAETFLHVLDSSQQCRDDMVRQAREHLSIPTVPPGPPGPPVAQPAPALR